MKNQKYMLINKFAAITKNCYQNPNIEVPLKSDALKAVFGAVLERDINDEWKPIAFASIF